MKKLFKIMIITLSIALFIGCGKQRQQSASKIKQALKAAGSNRAEIEQVLEHYSGDSLRLAAATFLIENMPGHVSYRDRDGEKAFYHIADSLFETITEGAYDRQRAVIDSLMGLKVAQFWKEGHVQDIEIISADFLIANIDSAFVIWEHSPWARHLDFDEFCETLLPYKITELQPLDDWRSQITNRYTAGIVNLAYCDPYRYSPVYACIEMNKTLRDSVKPDIRGFDYAVQILDMGVKPKVPFGNCGHYADLALAAMRSEGIPVVKDYIPIWSFRTLGHEWNAVLDTEGRWVEFGGALSEPGVEEKIGERKSKVFRRTYAHNPRVLELLASGEYVPVSFRSPFFTDVTASYIPCTDVEVEAAGEKDGYVYIALSDWTGWRPIEFARMEEGKATFPHIGTNSIYTVVRYDADGEQRVVTPPFRLDRKGKKHYIIPDESRLRTVTLNRKFPVLPSVTSAAVRINGAELHAADNPDFRNYRLIHKVADGLATAHEVKIADSIGAHRYWRYKQDTPGTYCNIAELKFIDADNREMSGRIIGTPGAYKEVPYATKEKAFDSDPLTIFEAPTDAGGWVGMDFGKPVRVEAIEFTGRGDGNAIERGDLYELFYFKDGAWRSLGQKNGEGVTVTFDNVPENALLLLRDRTKGKDERIFTYENGEQVWW